MGAVAWYAGILFPILGSIAVARWMGKQALRKDKAFLLAAALQAGHMAWALIGMLTLRILDLEVIIQIAIVAVGISWLLYKPGLGAVTFLTVYQLLGLSFNAVEVLDVPRGSIDEKSVVGDILWRLIALFLMWDAFVKTRRNTVHAGTAAH
jgi:hypothetical protein